jgi:hypothetical protein
MIHSTQLWPRVRGRLVIAAICMLVLSAPLVAAGSGSKQARGFVDGERFIDLVGDDCLRVQIWMPASLIRALANVDAQLRELVEEVHSLQMLVLDLSCGKSGSPVGLLRDEESRLLERGWERLVLVREDEAEIRVLVLMNDKEKEKETIDGLVLMIVDTDEGEMVFVNIAGTIDLAAIQRIAEGFDIPGLEDIELP